MSEKNKINQLDDSDFTKEDLEKIKMYLPHNYREIIIEKLNGSVGERMIYFVLNGERNDRYGIIDIAMDLAFEEKAKRDAIKKRINKLSK